MTGGGGGNVAGGDVDSAVVTNKFPCDGRDNDIITLCLYIAEIAIGMVLIARIIDQTISKISFSLDDSSKGSHRHASKDSSMPRSKKEKMDVSLENGRVVFASKQACSVRAI
jgi:hypothetical protein